MTEARPSWFVRLAGRLIPVESQGMDRQLRLYLAFVFVLFTPTTVAFAWMDWVRGERLTAGLVGGIGLVLLLSVQTLRRARDIRWGYRVVLGSALVLLNLVLYVGGGGGYAVVWYYAFPAGFYYVFGSREGLAWLVALVAPAAVVLFTDVGASYPPDLSRRFVVTYALVTALAYGLQRARDALQADVEREKGELARALAEVRTLSDMIPMCAWCRKVRDDEGYWSRIEEYLGRHAGSTVSHGLCSDCASRMEAGLDPEEPRPHPGAAGEPG